MASKSETGHGKNVANFEEMLSFIVGYGVTFNPVPTNIKLPALQTLHTNAKNSIIALNAALSTYTKAVNDRQTEFESLGVLCTRCVSILEGNGAGSKIIKDVQTVNRKIQGSRAEGKLTKADAGLKAKETKDAKETEDKNKKTINETTEETNIDLTIDPELPTEKQISVSQRSYTSQSDNFAKFISLLTVEPTFNPNEVDLKISALNAKLTNLKNSNTAVNNAFTVVSNTRIARDKILYDTTTGLKDISDQVKKYVKGAFGAGSPQYKQISGIRFRSPKKKKKD